MYFTRECYGKIEEIRLDNAYGSTIINYRVIEKNGRITSYGYDYGEDGIPYIIRYRKKFTLEGFRGEDGRGRTIALSAYLHHTYDTHRKPQLYSYMDFRQFIYISTVLSKDTVLDCINTAKNVAALKAEKKEKYEIEDVIAEVIAPFDGKATIINGYKAERIR